MTERYPSECNDHDRRITIVETQMVMLMKDVASFGKKLDNVVTLINAVSVTMSEQKGKADAKFGFTDMAFMVVLGAIGSYFVGTMIT